MPFPHRLAVASACAAAVSAAAVPTAAADPVALTAADEAADRVERFVEARHPEGVRFERTVASIQELL